MKKKAFQLSMTLLLMILSQVSYVNAITDSEYYSPNIIQFLSDDVTFKINTTLTRVVIFNAHLDISIATTIDRVIYIQFYELFNGTTNYYKSDPIHLSNGVNSFQYDFPTRFFNILGMFSFELLIYEDSGMGFKELLYHESIIVHVILNPFLVLNFIIIFLLFSAYLLVKKENIPYIFRKTNGKKIAHISSGSQKARVIPCPSCRQKIPEGSAYCSNCGYHLALFERHLL